MSIFIASESIRSVDAVSTGARPGPAHRLPRISTSTLFTTAFVVSLAPSLLPRSSAVQSILTGVLIGIALAIAWLWRLTGGRNRAGNPRFRSAAVIVGCVLATSSLVSNMLWQNVLRGAMDMDAVGWMYAVEIIGGSLSVAAILVGLGTACGRVARALRLTRTMILVGIAAVLVHFIVIPASLQMLGSMFSASASSLDPSIDAPTSSTRSGGAESLTRWEDLGREGRLFASGGTNQNTIRAYVGLDSAPTLDDRVDLAVDELDRAGAFDRSVIVVAVPTGSGWIDELALTGAENRFGGDVATVALQYSNKPSWMSFLLADGEAERSADALVRAVSTRAAADPNPPRVVIYGQSLGSVAGSPAYLSARESGSPVCGALWAGPPAGVVNTTGATVLSNSSDPVTWWSSRLLTSAPDLSQVRFDAPTPAWIPLVSYVQTSVDLLTALNVGPGHGHRYGTDQGTLLPTCS